MSEYIPQQLGELAQDYAAAKEGVNPLREPTEDGAETGDEGNVEEGNATPLSEEQINTKIAAYQQSQAFVDDKQIILKSLQCP